ncbi:NERD domain-containing protein [Pseudomonadota bacterium]
MSQMIPPVVAKKTPKSERQIFDRLSRDPETRDWIVLHSLGLSKTSVGPHGEIDFVVLVPGYGVLCIEVKGGEVSCTGGTWRTKNTRTGEIAVLRKSPYLQARENMFELMHRVQEHFDRGHPLQSTVFSYAVVFPLVDSPPKGTETEDWETFDRIALRTPISRLVIENLSRMRKKVNRGVPARSLEKETFNALRNFLRPDFERVVTRSATVNESEHELISLTQEQYGYLELAAANERALVVGAAGTGKTVLAIEYARRLDAEGRRVLLLCYNRLLGDWLREELRLYENVEVATFFSHAIRMIEHSDYADEFSSARSEVSESDLYEQLVPLYAEMASIDNDITYDALLVDEAQDLDIPKILPIFSNLLKGGLEGGMWAFFGDFTRQSLYSSGREQLSEESVLQVLRTYSPAVFRVPLRVNCRNTRQIGEETSMMSGFESLPYLLGTSSGLSVDYRYWKNRKDQEQKLIDLIRQMAEEGFSARDVVILGKRAWANSLAAGLPGDLPWQIVDLSAHNPDSDTTVPYSTVYAFKGMESPVVILTEIDEIEQDESRSLLYVGMSRARSHLVVLLHDKVKKQVQKKLTDSLKGDVT